MGRRLALCNLGWNCRGDSKGLLSVRGIYRTAAVPDGAGGGVWCRHLVGTFSKRKLLLGPGFPFDLEGDSSRPFVSAPQGRQWENWVFSWPLPCHNATTCNATWGICRVVLLWRPSSLGLRPFIHTKRASPANASGNGNNGYVTGDQG